MIFPVAVRTGLELRDRYVPKGGFSAVRDQAAAADRENLRAGRAISITCRRLSRKIPTRSRCAG